MKFWIKNSAFRIILAALLVLGGIAYGLADRYLIEHVEAVAVVPTLTTPSPAAVGTTAPTANSAGSSSSQLKSATATAAPTTEPASAVAVADDWSYQSETVSISVKQVSTGSGTSKVNYYVADVVLADASSLSSAFAKNKFGTNIIEYTSKIAADNQAVFAINGDYYGFRTDGIIIRNGVLYRNNPARTGLAFYKDGTMKIYDETPTSAQELLDAGVWNTLSFGPALLTNSVLAANLNQIEVDTNFGNHSIQGSHPRSGVGIIAPNHFVFIVVDGRSPGYSRGASLSEFAQIFKGLGCTDAYNIDGGGSSTMYFMGRVVNNPLGKNQERGTSDILFIGS